MNFLKKLLTPNSTKASLTVSSSNGFHLRPIALFVNESKKFDATIQLKAKGKIVSSTQVPKILSLGLEQGDTFTLICKGKEAQEANKKLSIFFNNLMQNDKEVQEIAQVSAYYESATIKGQTIAKGIAIGALWEYRTIAYDSSIEIDAVSLREAINNTKKNLLSQYEQHKAQEESLIFLAQKELLSSEIFSNNFKNIDELKKVIQQEIENLKGEKFESRIADYKDLEQQILRELGIHSELEVPFFPFILVAKELLPSEIDQLSRTTVKGVILQSGTITSHASILLRSAGIPSLIIHKEIELSKNAILDASSGDLILQPTKDDLKQAKKKQEAFIEALDKNFEQRFEHTKISTGEDITVLANVTDLISAKEAKGLGAEGIGLLRTEFLFTEQKPHLEEQIQAYKEIFELFDDITVRTLDIGGDKSLPYINISKESNPFLGVRGIRFSLQEQTLFKEQLLAIFKAVGLISSNKTIKIMFPMVSTTQEFIDAKNLAQTVAKENNLDISNLQFGIMLEVPSVIFALNQFDTLVDFYSIGSNDLTQYLFAIERTHPTLHVPPSSPALLSALKYIKKNTQKPISICGEIAGLEEATQELIEMGYRRLSVSSKLIPTLKESIRKL